MYAMSIEVLENMVTGGTRCYCMDIASALVKFGFNYDMSYRNALIDMIIEHEEFLAETEEFEREAY